MDVATHSIPLTTAIPAIKLPAMERAFMPAEAAFAERVIPSTDFLNPSVVISPFLQVLAYATILSSTFSICSANASALREELLNFSLNFSNCDNTSDGKDLVDILSLNNNVKAPFLPNRLLPFLLISSFNLTHFSLTSVIVFHNIANSLFFVVNIVLLISALWIHYFE